MLFEWDEEKRKSNLQKHGFDFADVEQIFNSEHFTISDERFDYGEIRYVTLGFINARIIYIAYSETEDVRIIITARKATKNEQRKFYNGITNRLGEN